MDSLKEYYMLEEIMSQMEINIKAIKPKNRQLSSCMVNVNDSLKSIFVPKSSENTNNWAVYTTFPFPIISKDEYLESKGTYTYEYKFFETYDMAVKYMAEKSFNYYKEIGDKIMTETYISVIEQLQNERPELWI